MSNIKVGTIIHASYGCTARGNLFYVVDSITKSGKSCTLRQIGNKSVSSDKWGQSGEEVPDINEDKGIVLTGKHKLIDGKWVEDLKPQMFKINNDDTLSHKFHYMHIWNGKPCVFYGD